MAKKFRFSLESLLQLRTYTADTKKTALAEVVRMREEKEQEIEKKKQYLTELASVGFGKNMLAGAMQAVHDHREYVKAEIEKLHRRRDQIIEIEKLKRKEFSDAMKDVKVLEKLKDKHHEQFIAEIAREERQFLDEVAQRSRFLSK